VAIVFQCVDDKAHQRWLFGILTFSSLLQYA